MDMASDIWTYFNADQTRQYFPNLRKLMDCYISIYQGTIDRAPDQLRKREYNEIRVPLYGKADRENRHNLSAG